MQNDLKKKSWESSSEGNKTRSKDEKPGWGGGGWDNLTFRKGVRLNNVEKSVDHVEEKPNRSWLKVSVGIVNSSRYKPKIQRLHRGRGPLSLRFRPGLHRGPVPLLLRLLLAAGGGPPAEQQDEPTCPQHGLEKSSFIQKKLSKNPSPYRGWRGETDEIHLSLPEVYPRSSLSTVRNF